MPGSVHSQEPQEQDQSMMDAEPETVDPIMLDEKRIVVVRDIRGYGSIARRNCTDNRVVARLYRDSGVVPVRRRGSHYG